MERMQKSRSSSVITSRKVVTNEHLNPNGTLFGGYLMCWMDEVAFMCARRFSGKPTCVTASVDSLIFKSPLHLGEHILLSATVCAVGLTSMQIEVLICKEDPYTGSCEVANTAYLTFVCLDAKLKPTVVPELTLESIEDQKKNREALLRAKVRKKLHRYLEKTSNQEEDFKPTEIEDKTIDNLFVDRILIKVGLNYDFLKTNKSYNRLRKAVESYI